MNGVSGRSGQIQATNSKALNKIQQDTVNAT